MSTKVAATADPPHASLLGGWKCCAVNGSPALWRTDTEARMTTTYRLLALVELAAPILMTALVVLVRVTT